MAEKMADDTLAELRDTLITRKVDTFSLLEQRKAYDELVADLDGLCDSLAQAVPTLTTKRDVKIINQAIEAVENLRSAVRTVSNLLGLLLFISSDQPPNPQEMVLSALQVLPVK
jgi:hypothetical protein